jgi:hypothetical protein
VSSIKRDSTSVSLAIGENFLYGFKGARSAPRAWRRVTAHAAMAGRISVQQEAGAVTRPQGNPPHHAAAALLSAKAHVGGRRGTDPGSSPHRLGAATRRACADGTILPTRPLLKPSQITVKARLCSQANR